MLDSCWLGVTLMAFAAWARLKVRFLSDIRGEITSLLSEFKWRIGLVNYSRSFLGTRNSETYF